MMSRQRNWQLARPDFRRSGRYAVVASIALAGGCSADIGRFIDSPSVGLSDKGAAPSEPVRRNAGAPMDPGTWPSSGPQSGSAIPQPRQASGLPPANQGVRVAGLPTASVAPAPGVPAATSGTIDVQPGDTLYAIAKRHRVSIAALMEANALTGPNLKPGQKLVLPVSAAQPKKPLTRPVLAVAAPAAPARTAPAAPAAAVVASTWEGTYAVKPGDSLFAVARGHKVSLAELQRVNNITEPTKVRPGVILKVPAGNASMAQTAAVPPAAAPAAIPALPAAKPAAAPPRVVAVVPSLTAAAPASPGIASPKIINAGAAEAPAEQKVASIGASAFDPPAAPPAAAAAEVPAKPVQTAALSAAKFRWPAKGKVIGEFGKRQDGTHNDGVNIAVPAGTDVHAAEGGTVAYAGSELKGYGNLVLIRHDNGWVSAYAHADTVLVKRGDAIKRGQVIAKAGKTGTVDQPQVHFELRQGSKPVDPLPHMERM